MPMLAVSMLTRCRWNVKSGAESADPKFEPGVHVFRVAKCVPHSDTFAFMARQYTLHRPVPNVEIDFAAELNPQQQAAVTAPPGPALVIAGAGSGKTRTLTYRVAYLLQNGVPPWNILLLTFTNKAAREMLERVTNLVPRDISGLWGGTFHSIGNRLLRRHPEVAGFRAGFSIMDREDQQDLLDAVIAAEGINTKSKRFPKGQVLGDIFSYALNTAQTIEAVLAEKYPYFLEFSRKIQELKGKYEARKKASNALDFDDLLEKPLWMLRKDEALAEKYRDQFQFILVDEYQDTNRLQAEFIDELGAKQRNVMVVGDDAQSIYSWRGADFRNILEFPKRYPEASVYRIETNYRSAPEILELANAAIAGNTLQFNKELQPARKSKGLRPALVALGDSNQQALFVAQRILDLRDEGVDLNEIAILYRAHFHSMELQMALTQHGIPFRITSGLRFFEQAHIKDVASFLKFAVNPSDEVAFKRLVKLLPGVGARSADNLWARVSLKTDLPRSEFIQFLLSEKVPKKSARDWKQFVYTIQELCEEDRQAIPSDMITSVVEGVYDEYLKQKFPNYEQRREDLNVLANYATQFRDTAGFLDQLALVTSLETESELAAEREDEMVNLSSIHQAKGLEYSVVFIVWLTEGMFPGNRSMDSDSSIEEERRLFYVSVTRAKDELYLTYPLIRSNANYGDAIQRRSRFLEEIPESLLEPWEVSLSY
jgi:DNA helicase-2/ATP-dependent DNA helicase PcrA